MEKNKCLRNHFLREDSFGFLIQMIGLNNKFNRFFEVVSSFLLTDTTLKQLWSLIDRKLEA